MAKNEDVAWLLKQTPDRDTIGAREEILVPMVKTILSEKNTPQNLPYIIGLFGTWGSGKTATLASLVTELVEEADTKIIYFNAWKYAGLMEIVPSMIYQILAENLDLDKESDREKIVRVMMGLGRKYSKDIGEWLKNYIAINPVEVLKNISEFRELIAEPERRKSEVLEQYYTQVDKAQRQLSDALCTNHSVTVVLIDELDRCDPDEAFNVIKQLRIFFCMRGIPIIFVVSANPDPIAQAIKHQYGLDPNCGDYETKRILEKFVDTYFDMSAPIALAGHIKHLWKTKTNFNQISFVSSLDDLTKRNPYDLNVVTNSNNFEAINTNNKFYNNLRVLSKSLDCAARSRHSSLLWTLWHLEILKQVDVNFRRDEF